MFCSVLFSLCWLRLQLAAAELDYTSQGQGMQLQGDYTFAGFFPLHYTSEPTDGLPALVPCDQGRPNKHAFHLMQAMRFAVEKINSDTGPQPLLPAVKLGYQMYDICSNPASVLATLDILEQQNSNYTQKVVGVIGPDSSSNTFTPAALLGAYLIPEISYEASSEMLSNKFLYPSFFRTIPNDKNQVAAMIQLLVQFDWMWIALLGSDNDYGLQGMKSLLEQAPSFGICIPYQGVIPSASENTVQTMRNMVKNIIESKVKVIVVFSSKTIFSRFLPFVLEKKITDKVWIGTEDWSPSTLISGIPGVQTIGTVIGVSVIDDVIPGFEDFEKKVVEASMQMQHINEDSVSKNSKNDCLQSSDLNSLARNNFTMDQYDATSCFNVYKSVYALAHALHKALGCDVGVCRKRNLDPYELLPMLSQVHFSLDNSSVYFNANGDAPTGYDIVSWVWKGTQWSLRVVGSFTPDPITLTVDPHLIQWHGKEESKSIPQSFCSPPCPKGSKKLLTGQHACCFDCEACPDATFLNTSEPTKCQPCPLEQWAPPSSEQCLSRTVLLLEWSNPLSIALLFFLVCCLLLTSSIAVILLLNLNTPVAKSAGGRTCLLMLAALTVAALSSLCHFGHPTTLACILKQPLFSISFSVCLACITVRALQVVCIFKFSSKLPPAYDRWTKKSGPEITIFLVSVTILLVSVLRVSLDTPQASRDLEFYRDKIVLECSKTLSFGSGIELACVSTLSVLCFSFSYMGKDLPANYNEAKCITFSLMVYMISWISFFTLYLISRETVTMAAQVFATLFSVLAFLAGYFFPKVYIIVFKPKMNTTAHFQNCIQMYTMNR